MKSIKKIKLSNILEILAVLFCVATAWALLANNAFATDSEEGTVEQANAETQKISFSASGLASGVTPQYTLTDNKKSVDYKLGDKLDVDKGASVTYSLQRYNYLITVKDSSHTYLFTMTTPLGYVFDKCSTSTTTITEDTDFVLNYKKDTKPYNLKVNVRCDSRGIAGAWVKLYYPDTETYILETARADGNCEFKDLEASQATGILIAGHEGYANSITPVTEKNYNTEHIGTAGLALPLIEEADMLLNLGEHHKTFEIEVKVTMGEVVMQDIKFQNETFYFQTDISVKGDWIVELDGALKYSATQEPVIQTMFLRPIGEEGYSLTKWKLDRGNNAEEYIEPGQTFTLYEGDKLDVVPIYEEAPQPGPTPPEPTPTPGEDVNATAQTGDSSPAIPLAILAIVSCVAVVFSRKKSLNK